MIRLASIVLALALVGCQSAYNRGYRDATDRCYAHIGEFIPVMTKAADRMDSVKEKLWNCRARCK